MAGLHLVPTCQALRGLPARLACSRCSGAVEAWGHWSTQQAQISYELSTNKGPCRRRLFFL